MYIDVFFAPPVPLFRTTCYVMYAQSAKRLWRFPGALKIELLSSATLTNLASLLHTCIGQERPFEHSLNTVLLWVCVSTYFFSRAADDRFCGIHRCRSQHWSYQRTPSAVWKHHGHLYNRCVTLRQKLSLSSLKFAGTQMLSSLLSWVFCAYLTRHN